MPSFAYLSPDEAIPQAKKAVAKALELDPDLPEAHTAHGLILATYEWDWVAAEREFKRSFELDPKIALAHFRYAWVELSPQGRHEEAITEMKRAMDLDPLSLIQGANFAAVYIYARQYDNALDQAMKTHDLDHSFFAAQNWLAHAYNVKGMYRRLSRSLKSRWELTLKCFRSWVTPMRSWVAGKKLRIWWRLG
jgi:tetratricopeptide (TPR) repeat protein